jgi:hypothetical protein
MNTRKLCQRFIATAVALLALLPKPLWACAVCYGDPNSSMTQGINAAVLSMVGVTTVVLCGFLALIIAIAMRTRRHRAMLDAANAIEGTQP